MEMNDMEAGEENGYVKCDQCGCAFKPELISERDADIEYTFFRCSYCGKAYMVSVTDSALRESIGACAGMVSKNSNGTLSDSERRQLQLTKRENVCHEKEVRSRYLQEGQP